MGWFGLGKPKDPEDPHKLGNRYRMGDESFIEGKGHWPRFIFSQEYSFQGESTPRFDELLARGKRDELEDVLNRRSAQRLRPGEITKEYDDAGEWFIRLSEDALLIDYFELDPRGYKESDDTDAYFHLFRGAVRVRTARNWELE